MLIFTSIVVGENESRKYWLSVLNSLKIEVLKIFSFSALMG